MRKALFNYKEEITLGVLTEHNDGHCEFIYWLNDSIIDRINVTPSLILMILEQIRTDTGYKDFDFDKQIKETYGDFNFTEVPKFFTLKI